MTTKRLEKLKQKQEQLLNQIKREETKEKSRLRKLETRRKILLGSLLDLMMEKDGKLREDVDKRLEGFLTRQVDREAFGLDPLAPQAEEQGAESKESAA